KEQMDLALSFAAEGEDPFAGYFTYGVVDTTFTFDRSAQNLGEFHIYPHNNKYFREFEIRVPDVSEKANFVTGDYGYVIEAYYPDKINKMLKIRLIGSSEGPYEVIKE
ncbi:MAG: hypothetical protein FWG51_03705, partial [Firmicutes bacterium]|nr:hypothetical protein [Bacillota bacterium]